MNKAEILRMIDHTLLKQDSTWSQIKKLCDEGLEYGTASVCIPPAYVRRAAEYLRGRLPVCTVTGFPNGYSTTAVKVFEASDAIANGADEIDMVINIGMLKEKDYDGVLSEIRAVRTACGSKLLKVIIEACLLTEDEKLRMCRIISLSGADYIKTSTGFSHGGATEADIRLFAANVAPGVGIKAAGGIQTVEDAIAMIDAGATRVGSSRLVSLLAER